MDRKGILDKEAPKVIIAVLVLLLFIIVAFGIIKIFGGTTDVQVNEIADSLEAKIDALDEGTSDLTFIGKEGWVLTGWGRSDEDRPAKCYFYSCLCVCPDDYSEPINKICQRKGICRRFDTPNVKISTSYNSGEIKISQAWIQNGFISDELVLSGKIKNHLTALSKINYLDLLFGINDYTVQKATFMSSLNREFELNFLFYKGEKLPIYFGLYNDILVMDDEAFLGKKISVEDKDVNVKRCYDFYCSFAIGRYSSDYILEKTSGHEPTSTRYGKVSGVLGLEPKMIQIAVNKNKNYLTLTKVQT